MANLAWDSILKAFDYLLEAEREEVLKTVFRNTIDNCGRKPILALGYGKFTLVLADLKMF